MIIRAESTLKAQQAAVASLNEANSQNSGLINYKELLGLSYDNNNPNLIPNRFKWGRNLIKVVD